MTSHLRLSGARELAAMEIAAGVAAAKTVSGFRIATDAAGDSATGPPMVRTRVAVLQGTGSGAAYGPRYRLDERTGLEGRLAVRDVHHQTGTTLSAIARRALTDHLGVGLFLSIGRFTSGNFDQTSELGLVLRRSWS